MYYHQRLPLPYWTDQHLECRLLNNHPGSGQRIAAAVRFPILPRELVQSDELEENDELEASVSDILPVASVVATNLSKLSPTYLYSVV